MQERLQQGFERGKDYWLRLSRRQRIIGIASVVAVIASVILLFVYLNKPNMVLLKDGLESKEAIAIKEMLDGEGIASTMSDDYTKIRVDKKDRKEAGVILISNDIQVQGDYNWEWALNNGFATTESEKAQKYKITEEQKYERDIMAMTGVEDASVNIMIPDKNDIILTQKQEPTASIKLQTNDDFTAERAEAIAHFVANAVGIKDMSGVEVINQDGRMYIGDSNSAASSALSSKNAEATERVENEYKDAVTQYVLNTVDGWTDAKVSAHVELEFDNTQVESKEYSLPEGVEIRDNLTKSYDYTTENSSGTGGPAGTDSNGGDTEYVMPDGGTSGSNTDIAQNSYLWNETITKTAQAQGTIIPDRTSVAISLERQISMTEDQARQQGLLDNVTYEEFQQSAVRTPVEITQETIDAVAMATGLDAGRIAITGYEYYDFQDTVPVSRPWQSYLPLVLAVIILALLGFVIYRGMAPVEVTEIEPELSVETLIATTKENQTLEEIEFDGKSDTRKQIEKFVEENPEAVAALLRNWLNEDWE